jgi:hypothetical protein
MESRLGWYCRAKRRAQGFTVEALAVRLGYRNLRKGVHWILHFEHDGTGSENLLINVVDILGLNYCTIFKLIEQDARSQQSYFWQERVASFASYCVRMGITFRPARRRRGRNPAGE